jgi:hypothetical protein
VSTAIQIFEDPAESTLSEADQLGAEITELCSYIYAAESRLLGLIREFDEKQYWAKLGLFSCAHWLNFKCGIGMNAAREKVRVAHALAGLPKISKGFADGKLSYSKVRAITRIADETNEDYLLMIAEHGTLIVKALEMAMDAAFVGAVSGVEKDVTAGTSEEREPIAARRADALTEIAETYMNNNESSGSTADRYQVIVHVAAETSHIEDGPHVYPKGTWTADEVPFGQTSRRIACDSSIVPIKEDKNGEPLSIGRRSRTIPPPMRRALRVRDKGCRFPGCTNTRFTDGHHIQHWADGGETSLDNLVMLCRHHHHLVHEGGFACEKSLDGDITFRDQREQPLESSPAMPGVASNDDVQQWMDREFFEANIDSETSRQAGPSCAARWHAGERMDWHAAVGSLFY